MSYSDNIPKLKPFGRGVSIIGVGATPFMLTKDDPEMNGITEGELFGYAAIEAMKDAGITAKDVDFYVHGQAGPGWTSNFATPNMHVANWFGMKGKGSFHHSEACCTGYVALETAANLIASGVYDIVLTGCLEMTHSVAYPTRVLTKRGVTTDKMFHETLCSTIPRDYTLFNHTAAAFGAEAWLDRYVTENHLSAETVEQVMTAMAKQSGRAAALNPLSLTKENYDEKAHAAGMDTAEEYLHSVYNPKLGRYVHAAQFELRNDGAGAIILCASDIAKRYKEHPIEILGIGHSCLENGTPALEKFATENAYKQVRDLTGLTGADMDLFMVNDFFQQSQILAADACEYIPTGKSWEYMLEGRMAFDGDRPVQTNGGRCTYGHAAAASGIHDHYEVVKQMRGEMGATQVNKPVKYAMLRGFGGGQNVTCTILKYND